MAIPGITYRLEKGTSLTHTEMDNNFRSVIYSSSIEDGGDTLHLHYDTSTEDFVIVPLNGGTGGLAITGNENNRIVTATGTAGLIQGESNFTFDGQVLTITGRVSQQDGSKNIFIGEEAGDSISGAVESVAIGHHAGKNLKGENNTAYGAAALTNGLDVNQSVAIGHSSLTILTTGDCNVALGTAAGINLSSGDRNVYLGNEAGSSTITAESDKLYINNSASDTPLILGDFSTQQITFSGGITGSSFTGSFVGDGSGLTGLTVTTEWDGTRDGNAEITGSFTVSGSSTVVDFTNVDSISGSIFSGSFVGDGSGLTGIVATVEWDGSRDGNAEITGSFVVSGSSPTIELKGETTIDENIKIHNFNSTTIGVGFATLQFANPYVTNSVAVGNNAACLATGRDIVAVGRLAGVNTSDYSTLIGSMAARNNTGFSNTAVGYRTIGGIGSGRYNTAIGSLSQCQVTSGHSNTGVGYTSLRGVQTGAWNAGVGAYSLYSLNSFDNRNTALGTYAGFNAKGSDNVLIGFYAGPEQFTTTINNKLYIHNQKSDTPLIYGDFSTGQLTIHSQVSASIFSGSFHGDGSNLTGVEWDGSRNGNAEITGSFVVSGSSVTVDLTDTLAISGSIFSGSFTGNGSGLTDLNTEWDGTHNGNAEITGSLIVTQEITTNGPITITNTSTPTSPGVEFIHFHSASLAGVHNLYTFGIDNPTGYTGIKVEYSLHNLDESEKKIGTILGGWDLVGNSTINDSFTQPQGLINNTSFSIDASSTTQAILKLDASAGTYDINMIITAFKRQA